MAKSKKKSKTKSSAKPKVKKSLLKSGLSIAFKIFLGLVVLGMIGNFIPGPGPDTDSSLEELSLYSKPDLTGFLEPGTQVQFTAFGIDMDDTLVPNSELVYECFLRYSVTNPVGSTVATINEISGLLVVGNDPGAAMVTASCAGLVSNAILVSTKGGDGPDPQPQPDPNNDDDSPGPTPENICNGRWYGNGVLTAPGYGNHKYQYTTLDFTHLPEGSLIEITLELGNGYSDASLDLFPPDAIINSNGYQQESVCNIYDQSSGTSASTTCHAYVSGVYHMGVEGNWFSDRGSTNTYNYEVVVLRCGY